MSTLFAEIDGKHVSLQDCDWVMWGPCGCPFGVTVARSSPTEDLAWRSFYDTKREIQRAQKRGDHLELITHARWCAEVIDQMKAGCPHEKATS